MENDKQWDLSFEPDRNAEEQLSGSVGFLPPPEEVDPLLITDQTVRRCRILAAVRCIEYGTTSVSPTQSTPAVLLVINFTFHPFESRVKEALVELSFAKGSIVSLQPESIHDSETTETIRKKLTGEVKLGYPPVGIAGGVGAERETETTTISALRIWGSGEHTHRVVWTMQENPQDKKGIHLNFTAVVVAAVEGETEVEVVIRAKLGLKLSLSAGRAIRMIKTRKMFPFDGKTLLGIRPTTLEVHENVFRGTLLERTNDS